MFPFTYNGEQYNSCTDTDSHKLWCATTADYGADHKWGYCQSKMYYFFFLRLTPLNSSAPSTPSTLSPKQ